MKLQARFDNLGCSQESFAAIAAKRGPLFVCQPDISRWFDGDVRPKLAQQLERVLTELEELTGRLFNGIPVALDDVNWVLRQLKCQDELRQVAVPSTLSHATWPPQHAKAFAHVSEGVVERHLESE